MSTEKAYLFRPPVFALGHTVPGMDSDDRLYTVSEATTAFRIGRTHLYKLIGQGHVRIVKLGSRTLVPRSEVRRLIEAATVR